MKKLLAIALVLTMLLPLVGIAEEKYTGMSMSELQAEFTAILQAMWKTDEWQKVLVPAGVYKVGEELPTGEWTLTPSTEGFMNMADIKLGTKLNESKTDISSMEETISWQVLAPGMMDNWTFNFKAGWYVVITSGGVYFSTPIKGQGITFK